MSSRRNALLAAMLVLTAAMGLKTVVAARTEGAVTMANAPGAPPPFRANAPGAPPPFRANAPGAPPPFRSVAR
jgi:hypothetical protein